VNWNPPPEAPEWDAVARVLTAVADQLAYEGYPRLSMGLLGNGADYVCAAQGLDTRDGMQQWVQHRAAVHIAQTYLARPWRSPQLVERIVTWAGTDLAVPNQAHLANEASTIRAPEPRQPPLRQGR
jgi:hypothetical protein